MLDIFNNYRMIDLSEEIQPGVLKINGQYSWGKHIRRFQLRQFEAATDHTFMNFVEAETHIGTHVEVPAHLTNDGKGCSEMPLETFMGETIVLQMDSGPIHPAHLSKVHPRDILLLWSAAEDSYITEQAAQYLLDKPIKMLGVQNVAPDDPRAYEAGSTIPPATHQLLLSHDIPIIECLVNLQEIKKERVFFIGFPLRIAHLDSSWIRAVAFEPLS